MNFGLSPVFKAAKGLATKAVNNVPREITLAPLNGGIGTAPGGVALAAALSVDGSPALEAASFRLGGVGCVAKSFFIVSQIRRFICFKNESL